MDYSILLSGVELAEKAEKMTPGTLYPSASPFQPDLFTDQVVEALVDHYGTVSRFCSMNGISRKRQLRALTPQGENELPLSIAKAVCESLGLDMIQFANRIFEPIPSL